ncbi:Nif3-like dinuclear metal center hexameric protein [Paractinoplanes atraurantiacus]|uniref:GTP cyclohydrolase 1 type 2 homolog n=1 Tax=Paractinoplanes atraurantiacus TaxID=1036182 RepID=A0A285HDV6_9ACTN|nr:Nif3-like dinuclear metal center hexameric protein [Actinoplanes atraurantiacus]SNY33932.1 dinuclear metal center protein, YbgI/SA1388 family [Actinoplanes atraurantiacus]
MTDNASVPTVRDVIDALDRRYPREWAESWDRVGMVLGDFDHPVRRVLCVVDCVPETAEEAISVGADLIVAHHPLLLKPVSSIAPDTYKGRVIHRLIRSDVALYVAHTNADVANPGVSDALAARLGLRDLRPLIPSSDDGRGLGRIGVLDPPMDLSELTGFVASRLPATAAGVRSAGDPSLVVRTLAVCGGAGDTFLADAARAGVDAYLCADLRHHPASEHVAGEGPALIDVAHWATERPWLDDVAAWLRGEFGFDVVVSDLDTDPWTLFRKKEPLP